MGSEVICDTNIWYYLGNGKLSSDLLRKHTLIATFYNFEELITTPNILSDFQQVRKAAKAIVDFSSLQVLENAFLYLANIINPSFEDRRYSYNLGMRNWNEIRKMAELDDSFTLSPKLIKEYEKNIGNKIANSEELAKIENEFVAKVRNHSKISWKQSSKKYYRNRFNGILFELTDYLNIFSNSQVTFRSHHIKQVELFLTVFLQFSRNSEIAKWVVQPNDAYDLYNLIYVKPGQKYFTMEKRWKNLIVESGLGHYLLEI